jgi:hypothetical protein
MFVCVTKYIFGDMGRAGFCFGAAAHACALWPDNLLRHAWDVGAWHAL